MLISTALNIEDNAFVSLVGAGGKSSILQALAAELLKKNKNIILTTTTKMFIEQMDPFLPEGRIIESSNTRIMEEGIKDCFKQGKSRIAILVSQRFKEKGRDKFSGPEPYHLDYWWKEGLADYFIVEADGAKGRPIKAPSYYEPVIPVMTTDVVGVIGIEAIGSSLEEKNVFRSSLFGCLLGLEIGEVISIKTVVDLINHPDGLFKNSPHNVRRHLFLNKVNGEDRRNMAEKLAYRVLMVNWAQICDIIIGDTLQKGDPILKIVNGKVI